MCVFVGGPKMQTAAGLYWMLSIDKTESLQKWQWTQGARGKNKNPEHKASRIIQGKQLGLTWRASKAEWGKVCTWSVNGGPIDRAN